MYSYVGLLDHMYDFFISDHGMPTSIDFNGCDPAHMVASFNTGDAVIYDLETSQPIVVFSAQGESGTFISTSQC